VVHWSKTMSSANLDAAKADLTAASLLDHPAEDTEISLVTAASYSHV
jgi:hypothetical protein